MALPWPTAMHAHLLSGGNQTNELLALIWAYPIRMLGYTLLEYGTSNIVLTGIGKL